MAFEDADRRRTTLLAILTLIALPAIYLVTRDDMDALDEPAAVSLDDGSGRPPIDFVQDDPVFLDAPVAVDEEPVSIAVPEAPENAPMRLTASFRSNIAGGRTCLVKDFDSNVTVTIRNLDNNRRITCVTSLAPFTQVHDVVLPTETFSNLADVTAAPITIELTR